MVKGGPVLGWPRRKWQAKISDLWEAAMQVDVKEWKRLAIVQVQGRA
jgi:hypothetical protein